MHNVTVAFAVLLVMLLSYFFGCFNGSFMVSHFIIRDDVRKHGSGNAGLTNSSWASSDWRCCPSTSIPRSSRPW